MRIWDEITKAAKHKERNYPNRQNELAILCRALEKIPEEDFYRLSPLATEWYNEAADAINDQTPLPEPNNVASYAKDKEALEKYLKKYPEESSQDTDHESDEAAADASGDSDGDDDTDTNIDEEDLEGDDEREISPPKTAKKPLVKEPKKTKAPVPVKTVEADEDGEATTTDDEVRDVPSPKKPGPKPKKSTKTPYDTLSGNKDRYGTYEGTNTSKAVALYEKGATVRQVSDVLGGKYRNILKRLVEEGHLVEKLEGGVYRVTHKDDVVAKGKKK